MRRISDRSFRTCSFTSFTINTAYCQLYVNRIDTSIELVSIVAITYRFVSFRHWIRTFEFWIVIIMANKASHLRVLNWNRVAKRMTVNYSMLRPIPVHRLTNCPCRWKKKKKNLNYLHKKYNFVFNKSLFRSRDW